MRWLRRQRDAQGLRGHRAHAGLPARGIQPQPPDPRGERRGLPVLNAFKRRFDPRNYNGATLLGLRGIVVKSHGSADRVSFRHALTGVARLTKRAASVLRQDHRAHVGEPAKTSSRAMTYSRIVGTGSYLPAKVVTQRRVCARGSIPRDEWIRARTGIRAAPSRRPRARNRATSRSRPPRRRSQRPASTPADLDLIIVATSTPDLFSQHGVPAAGELGTERCPAFDVQAVCSGFVYALDGRR